MTDKELLELAAKAIGYTTNGETEQGLWVSANKGKTYGVWNPLADDGDALRLAVKLGIDIEFYSDAEKGLVYALNRLHPLDSDDNVNEPYGDDPYAATRRAIVRAAAEIGRSMK